MMRSPAGEVQLCFAWVLKIQQCYNKQNPKSKQFRAEAVQGWQMNFALDMEI